MKKRLALLFALVLTIILFGCAVEDEIEAIKVNPDMDGSAKFDEIALLRVMHDDLEDILQSMVDSRGGQIGISYLCLTTNRHISINGDALFNAASTSKLPTHMMIADAVHSGTITWDSYVTFDPSHHEGGTGILQNSIRPGDTVTVGRLVELSIVYSDNIAHNMLSSAFVGRGRERMNAFFNRYLPTETTDGTNHLTPNQLMQLLQILHEGQDEVDGYRRIIEHMSNTAWMDRLYSVRTSNYLSHIIGTFGSYAHDAGIFHLEHPYILVVMTNAVGGDFISDISHAVFDLHDELQSFIQSVNHD